MKMQMLAAATFTMLLPALATASPAEDENAALRAQVEQLKTQLQAAQANCAVSSTAPAAPAASVSSAASPKPEAPTGYKLVKEKEKPEVPAGYKLVKIEPVLPKDDRWKDPHAWESLFKGMSKQDVEGILGLEHTSVEGNGRTFWGYGKVGNAPASGVIFVNDKLAVWVTPDF